MLDVIATTDIQTVCMTMVVEVCSQCYFVSGYHLNMDFDLECRIIIM